MKPLCPVRLVKVIFRLIKGFGDVVIRASWKLENEGYYAVLSTVFENDLVVVECNYMLLVPPQSFSVL